MQTATVKPRRPHRIPLGLLMLARGDITDGQLGTALAAQRTYKEGRIGDWLERLRFATGPQITAALGAQWACPVLPNLPRTPLDTTLPLPLLVRFRMAPVHYALATRVLHMAFAESVEYPVLLAIEQAMECRAEPCMVASPLLDSMLDRLQQAPRRPDQIFSSAHSHEEIARTASGYAAMLSADSMRLVRCGEFIWIRLHARQDVTNLLFSVEALSSSQQTPNFWRAAV